MKTIIIVLTNIVLIGFLGLSLIFLNTYVNGFLVQDDLKGIWNFILRFMIVNLENISVLFLLNKIVGKFIGNVNLTNKILIYDILIILIWSGLLFFQMSQKDI